MFSAVSASAGTAENGAPRQNARQKDLVRSMKAKRKAYDGWYNRYWKRVLDAALAVPLLLAAAPLYCFISAAILLDDGRPVFYRSLRGGYRGKAFIAGKFGTIGINKEWRLKCA